MEERVILEAALTQLEEPWRPKVIGRMNEHKLMVVLAAGEFVWHSHEETDAFYMVLAGEHTIELADRPDA